MLRVSKLLVSVLSVLALSNAYADDHTETRVYAGLAWELGHDASVVPDVVLGVRSLSVSTSDNVQGADLNAHVNLKGGVALDNCRLSYVGGQRDIMGNVGVGYSFRQSKILGTVAIQGPYSRAGLDYAVGGDSVTPYVEVNTLSKPDAKSVAEDVHPS
jgi:hypothetical protein